MILAYHMLELNWRCSGLNEKTGFRTTRKRNLDIKLPGHIFILGDNRIASRDSRAIGAIPLENVTRRAWLVYWPLDELKILP